MSDAPAVSALSTQEKRALLERLLAERAARPRQFPLSFAQLRLWFIDQLQPGSAAYHIVIGLQVDGRLDVRLLGAALCEVIRRHQSLRTTFAVVDEQPVQVVDPHGEAALTLIDLRELPPGQRKQRARRAGQAASQLPFDLGRGPLLRLAVVRLDAGEHLLYLAMHHIVSDLWSVGTLIRELATIYESFAAGRPSPLAPLPLQYVDFAQWQRGRLSGERLEQEIAWWRERLAGAPAVLDLPTDRPRPSVQSYRGSSLPWGLRPQETGRLAALAQREGATLFMVLLAGFALLLSRASRQDDVSIGTPIAGRGREELEGLIGLFANVLVLRTDLAGDPTFRELLGRVRETSLGAFEHQEIPFEKLVDALQPARDPSHNPLFQVQLVLQNTPEPRVATKDLVLSPLWVDRETAKLDLLLELFEAPDGLGSVVEYNVDLFDRSTVRRLLVHLAVLLAGAAADPDRRISELPLLSPHEREQILAEWNDTAEEAAAVPVHRRLAARAALASDAPAVADAGHRLTYGDLAARANRLAHRLRRLGVGPEVLVGVFAERSADLVAALLGILEAGGAYLPLDPSYPEDRLRFMLDDSGTRFLVAQGETGALSGSGARDLQVLRLDDPTLAEENPRDPQAGREEDDPARLAYVLYTSGSTGRPKGVQVTHGALANFLEAMGRRPGLAATDVLLATTSLSFDIAALEIYLPLLAGARLVIAGREEAWDGGRLRELIAEHGVTVMQGTPSTWRLLVESGWRGSPGFKVLCGGEALPPDLAAQLQERAAEVWNLYGPTETTVWSAVDRLAADAPVSLGRPIANTELYVLDQGLDSGCAPAPVGHPGELLIGGAGLARGYLGRPDLTAERFVPHPFADRSDRLYRTGDLVRYRPDGRLEFLGRIDNQVKVRGFRIELAEIEAVLGRHPDVAQAVVAVQAERTGNAHLAAWLVPGGRDAEAASLLIPRVREALALQLPPYMLPSSWSVLSELPLTPNGKIDRKALLRTTQSAQTARPPGAPIEAPRSLLEQTLAQIWRELLGRDEIDVHDNFFDIGGHSLLMPSVQSRLRERLGREVGIVDLFRHPTLRALARHLGGEPDRALQRPAAVPVPRSEVFSGGTGSGSIAVIGMAGRFPGADSVAALWANLRDGREAVETFTDDELRAAGVPADLLAHPHYVKAGPVLADVELFDAELFGFSPREAEMLDPQHRLFLETSWHALEDAGYDPRDVPGRTGVWAGADMSSYVFHLLSRPDLVRAAGIWASQQGVDKDFLATRVSYELNLKGPSLSVQTACSTSLVAVHLACRSLAGGECDVALAGGVNVQTPQRTGYLHEEGAIHSPDGHCRAFDARARGTFFGNGVGVVVLKRLEDALRDGDSIRAVIRGTAINNDGSLKVGYTAPSVDGQAEVIATAQAVAGVEPGSIGYVEAHGTGTPLGDPIEVAALTRAFRGSAAAAERRGFCGLGSIKTNIGHLGSAAGVAGLIKTVLALEHRQIPPSLHFETPNPALALAASPFRVVDRLTDWETDGAPRRAGVSSFGIGGTNAHAVLEEAPAPEPSGPSRPHQLLLLSAHTSAALEEATGNLAAWLEGHPEVAPADLADVAHTLRVGRHPFEHRRMLVSASREDALAALASRDPERLLTRRKESEPPAVAWLLPGQGSQHAGMGRDLYAAEPLFRREVDRCAEVLAPRLGRDLREVLFGSEADLTQTRLAQPALFVVEHALAQLWLSWGVRPRALIGHSLGEYVAACLAGVLSLEDALELVAARGELMQELPPGAMLSVDLAEPDVLAEIAGSSGSSGLALAAVNAPGQAVVSGPEDEIAALAARLAARGVPARRLHTSHAFHSSMMDPVLDRFTALVSRLELRPPALPYLSNLTGGWITAAEATDPRYWARHLRETVRFGDGIGHLLAGLPRGAVLLEVGPGQALGRLVRRQAPGHPVISSMPHSGNASGDATEAATLLQAMGRLWLAGAEVDWQAFQGDEHRRRVPLPTYPFQRRRYWIDHVPLATGDGIDGLLSRLESAGWRLLAVPPGEDGRTLDLTRPEDREALRGCLERPASPGPSPPNPLSHTHSHPPGRGGTSSISREVDSLSLGRGLGRGRSDQLGGAPLPGGGSACGRGDGGEGPGEAGHPRPDLETPYVEPRTDSERRLAGIWASLLGLARVGVHDDFFELGGHSLLATRLLSRVREACGREITLESVFAAPTVARLAAHIEAEPAETAAPLLPPILPIPRTGDLPLSLAQQRLLFVDFLSPGDAAYNLPLGLRLDGALDPGALRQALAHLVDRHEVLRTTFRVAAGQASQVIAPAFEPPLPVVDLSALPAARQDEESLRTAVAEARRPFDLLRGPVLRALLLRRAFLDGTAVGSHVLLLTLHHIAGDGWSWGVLFRDLVELYEALVEDRPARLPELPVQYADFAAWQRNRLDGEVLEEQIAYWRRQLAGLPVLDLPADHPRPAVRTGRGAALAVQIPGETVQALHRLGRDENATLFMTLTAAFSVLLHHDSQEDDLVVGTDVANRTRGETEDLIGLFVNQLVLRNDLSGDPALRELLRRVRDVTLAAFAHQDAPFDKLVEALNPVRDMSRTPLFQIKLVLQNTPAEGRTLRDLTVLPYSFFNETAKFDLLLNLSETGPLIQGQMEYSTDLYEPETIERMLARFVSLLESIAARPDARLSEIEAVLAEAERQERERRAQERREARSRTLGTIRRRTAVS